MIARALNLNRVFHADCREFLASLLAESVSACVCDPPSELGFMGKKWDNSGIAYDVAMWREVLRVLKPGGVLLDPFAGSGTTLLAAQQLGFPLLGCEREAEHVAIIHARLGLELPFANAAA